MNIFHYSYQRKLSQNLLDLNFLKKKFTLIFQIMIMSMIFGRNLMGQNLKVIRLNETFLLDCNKNENYEYFIFNPR